LRRDIETSDDLNLAQVLARTAPGGNRESCPLLAIRRQTTVRYLAAVARSPGSQASRIASTRS